MQIRNALIFLQKMKNIFPVIRPHAESILKYLEIAKNLEMNDLKQTTESYENIIRKKMDTMADEAEVKKITDSAAKAKQSKSIKKVENKEDFKQDAQRKEEGKMNYNF